jgi:gluconate 2-dehydrogenase gamma chain
LRAAAQYAASVAPEQPYEFFTPEQARDFDAISAQIVPTDDIPGAREAHVVRFVDRYLATVAKNEQPRLQDDFKLLGDAVAEKTPGSRSFGALSDTDQMAFLTQLEKSHADVFDDFRDLTMLGMFSDPVHGGNFNKVGWKLIGFEDRFSWKPPFGYYDRV